MTSNIADNPIRVLLVDDHQLMREGLRELIQSQPGMSVIGDAGTGAGALSIASREQPDIIILDLDMGNEDGLNILPELINAAKQSNIIILTGGRDPEKRDKAMELGAKGVVLKENGATELLSAIEKVYRTGEYWFEVGAAKRLLDRKQARTGEEQITPEAARNAELTPTERTLITYLGKGMDNRQIANEMNMAESTVRNNLTRIYDKLQIKGGRLALLVYAYQHGLVKP
jgi:DNA-binding NarL/FixJ family response regulator